MVQFVTVLQDVTTFLYANDCGRFLYQCSNYDFLIFITIPGTRKIIEICQEKIFINTPITSVRKNKYKVRDVARDT